MITKKKRKNATKRKTSQQDALHYRGVLQHFLKMVFIPKCNAMDLYKVPMVFSCSLLWLVNLVCPTKVHFSLSKHGLI